MWVVEVKSLTTANEVGQMRLAIGQILDYTHMVRSSGRSVQPVIAVEHKPKSERWSKVCHDLGIALVWPETFARLLA